jgi:arylsulfatase
MADDLGYASLGSYHQRVKSIEAPHLDQLASEGVRLTDHYAKPSCTAGRSAFITGQLSVFNGLRNVGLPCEKAGLNPDDPTIASLLKKLGYTTGQFGKNHLGDRNDVLPILWVSSKGFFAGKSGGHRKTGY